MVVGELTIFCPLRNINTTLGPVMNHRLPVNKTQNTT